MNQDERVQLLYGPYSTPRCRMGKTVACKWRGEVVVCGMTEGRIPWPIGKKGRTKSLVLFRGLAEAVRKESNLAVCYWWGVTPQTVTKWRSELGVGPVTDGTKRLKRENALGPAITAARIKGQAAARSPDVVEKRAAALRGKPKPPHVVEAMRRGRAGKAHSPETRQKMREGLQRWQKAKRSAVPQAQVSR